MCNQTFVFSHTAQRSNIKKISADNCNLNYTFSYILTDLK